MESKTLSNLDNSTKEELKSEYLKHIEELFSGEIRDYRELQGELTKRYYETIAKAEMREHLGYDYQEKSSTRRENSRNGFNTKKIKGEFGEIQVDIPRDRNGEFEPQILKKRETKPGIFSKNIISMYARGMSTREIEEHVHELYGVDISPQFVSRVTEELLVEFIQWQARPLDGMYPVVYVDGLRVPIKSESGPVLKKCIYIVLGITGEGKKDVLGLWVEETEGARFWLKVFNDLFKRGLQDILIVCGDGLKGLDEAIHAVYPNTDLQLCVVHQVRNSLRFVSYKDRKNVCADMKDIYSAATTELAQINFAKFKENWGKKYPAACTSWENNWSKLTTFFNYPPEMRIFIYTTNAIESLNSMLRKNTNNRKLFPNDNSALKLLYVNIKNFSKKLNQPPHWNIIANQLTILFGDRFIKN